MFNINYGRLVVWHLSLRERQPGTVSALLSFVTPIVRLYNLFLTNRDKNIYKLTHDSAVYSMENVFNDRFDSSDRRIYITDGFTKDRVYLYTRLEDKPHYLGFMPLYNRADYADTGVDFIVWVPMAILLTNQDLIELTALVNEYKLTSKRFKIYRV